MTAFSTQFPDAPVTRMKKGPSTDQNVALHIPAALGVFSGLGHMTESPELRDPAHTSKVGLLTTSESEFPLSGVTEAAGRQTGSPLVLRIFPLLGNIEELVKCG